MEAEGPSGATLEPEQSTKRLLRRWVRPCTGLCFVLSCLEVP